MRKNRIVFQVVLILGFALQGLILCFTPANAQFEPVLSLEPTFYSVQVGEQVTLELAVTDGRDVNAFDITLVYDQAYLDLDEWSHGGYLNGLSCLHLVNQPGLLELACTQIARPPVSGDGVLLRLVFDSLAAGYSPVDLTEAIFADPMGVKTYPERVGSVIEIRPLPTLTRTSTLTSTVTATPTVTPTQTDTQAPTTDFTATSSATQTLTPAASQNPATTVTGATPSATATPMPSEAAQSTSQISSTAGPGTLPATGQIGGGTENPLETTEPVVIPNQAATGESEKQGSRGWLEALVWITLFGGLIALGVMWTIIIRQKRDQRKEEDLLL